MPRGHPCGKPGSRFDPGEQTLNMSEVVESHHPFLIRDARALGIIASDLRSDRFRRVFRGVAVRSEVPDTVVVRSRAALLVAPSGSSVSHWSAARLWGGTTPDDPRLHLAIGRDHQMRIPGIRLHRHRHQLHVVKRHGLPVIAPLQTFGHLARLATTLELVALGDSLVRKNRFTPTELVTFSDAWEHQCRREMRMAARLVREGVDSAPETALRLLIVLAGLPEPEVDIRLYDADGDLRHRLDLGYREAKLAVEYDGRWHHTDEQRALDRFRRESLSSEGWTFVVVTADELYGDTEALLARIIQALADHGLEVPRMPLAAWRAHFRCPTFVAAA